MDDGYPSGRSRQLRISQVDCQPLSWRWPQAQVAVVEPKISDSVRTGFYEGAALLLGGW